MYKLLFAFSLVIFAESTFAQAQSEVPTPKESIGAAASRLSFVLPEGVMSLGIFATSIASSADVKYNGKNLYSQTLNGTSFSSNLTYAYKKNNTFTITLPITGSQNSEIAYGPASIYNGTTDKTTNKGMSNPTIGLTTTEVGERFNFKYGLSYRPAIMTAKSATATSDGNLAEAQPQTSAFFSIFKKSEEIEFGGTLSFSANGSGKRENASTGVQSDVSGGNTIGLSIVGQKYFNKETSGLAGLTFNSSADQTSGTTTLKSFNFISYGIGMTHSFQDNNNFYAKYEFAPNISFDLASVSQNYSGNYTFIGTMQIGSDWYF